MSYRLERFGELELAVYDVTDDVGTFRAATGAIALPGGGFFDQYGGDLAPRENTLIRRRFSFFEDTKSDLVDAHDALRALVGKRAKLFRRRSTGLVEWCWARLLHVPAQRTARQQFHQPLECIWEMVSDIWYGEEHGAVWTFDSGEFFDTGLFFDPAADTLFTLTTTSESCACPNNGNRVVENAVITVTAAGSAITQVTIISVSAGISLKYVGSIAAGEALVIDCGAKSVKDNGVDAYSGFTLESGHTQEEWLPLEPGTTTLTVARTGGNSSSTIRFEYSDGMV